MNIKNLAMSYILILLVSISLFAQNQDKGVPNNSALSLPDDGISLFGGTTLLPQKPDTWSAVIVSSGGLMGTQQLVAAVNSDGNFVCEKKAFDEKNILNKESVAELFSLTEKLPTTGISGLPIGTAAPVQYCNDCIAHTLIFSKRSKESTNIAQYRYRVLPRFSAANQPFSDAEPNEAAMRIFQEVLNLSGCN